VWQQHFFFLAKMNHTRLVPKCDESVRLPFDSYVALLRRSFGRAPHPQRLNQRKVMMLAHRMQTRMAFHARTSAVGTGAGNMLPPWAFDHRAYYPPVRPMG
jgi:hypothetical protein